MNTPSVRAEVITRRTYSRPLNEQGTAFETWGETVARVLRHQEWLWERAKGSPLSTDQYRELWELGQLLEARKVSVSGRTLWLGGTDVAKRREASMFNCSFGRVETVHDVVDAFWLLLQGCGVGFEPVVGTLSGFTKPVEVKIIRSTRETKGNPKNVTSLSNGVYTITVGDSAEAWSKSVGKILAMKDPIHTLVLDFTEIRPAGERLKGYGWISSGDETISKAFVEIAHILNRKADQLLDRLDILDILNWLGTSLSSRRSAEIAVVPFSDPDWKRFATAKKDHWVDNPQRAQSNNSLLFYTKPSREDLEEVFELMQEAGGSEPGFINAEAALKRAPWFKGVNPCCEILLSNKSFCNLVEVDLGKFNGDDAGLQKAIRLVARANYRQTCVDLDDGILQRSWHELNQFLRLCGVGLTGVVRWEHQDKPMMWQALRSVAQSEAEGMAQELDLPKPKAVTTIKPSGTLSKVMDTSEGCHRPLGKYIFNNVRFSKYDKLIPLLREAGYRVFDDPYSSDSTLVTFPVSYDDVEFDIVDDKEVNIETAIDQLERYKILMDNYVDHNCSITVSYGPEEIPAIIDWLLTNWDSYVGVSFIYRNDPTKTAQDLGYPYLPQEVVTRETWEDYVSRLKPFSIDKGNDLTELGGDDCATGACPIR